MQQQKIAGEKVREVIKDRIYIELKPGCIPNINHFGKLQYSHANPALPMHTHAGVMEICYLDGGEQVFCVDGREYHMHGGDIFVTYPGEQHSTGLHPMEKSTLYWIGINLEYHNKPFLGYAESEAESLRANLRNLKPRIFTASPVVRDIMEKAIASYFGSDIQRKILFRNHVTEYLLEVCRCAQLGKKSAITSLFTDLLAYIDQHYQENLSVKDLADQAQLSLPRFKKRFKAEVGIAPNEFILRKKIDHAKDELARGKKSITAIALSLGFSSSQYFATVFKRFTGKIPRQFV
jgi:AraC-like DNA-binding protein